ncbi:MAG: glycosidase, partial [Phycisphaerae bacterium]
MSQEELKAKRRAVRLEADPKRVIARLFLPGGESRVAAILDRVLALSEAEVSGTLTRVLERYSSRHKDIGQVLEHHYDAVAARLNGRPRLLRERRWLIGAYFTSEYSLESVALFNPSIVLHPNQSGMSNGKARFIMSLRACGEGHISSIEFRSGVIDSRNGITFDPLTSFAVTEQPVDDHLHDKNRFYLKLNEMGAYRPLVDRILQQLPEEFTISDLERAIETGRRQHGSADGFEELTQTMLWLAHSSYRLAFPADSAICERVIFPVTE